jgi:hypothetical protein
MARSPLSFKQRDVTRAFKAAQQAAQSAGLRASDVNIRILKDGTIAVSIGEPKPMSSEGKSFVVVDPADGGEGS